MTSDRSSIDHVRSPAKLVFYLAFAVVLYLAFGSLGLFIVGLLFVIELGRVLVTGDVDDRYVVNLLLGTLTIGGSLVWIWLASESGHSLLWPSLVLFGGLWMILDTRVARLTATEPGGSTTDRRAVDESVSDVELLVTMQNARLLTREMRTAHDPLTVTQLADRCTLHEERVADAIRFLSEDGTVYPVESARPDQTRYAIDESMLGASWAYSQLRYGTKRGLRRIGHRVARPLRFYLNRG
ncbi:hypothetical protein [Halovivax gelatinilyticus]|uniref:hypothetical protein n=1 Tax=Halovivax gelatinilyticus TaxID=2961597 RepID=UPI0020CA2E6A|nr:hypothetical protein [Halovivax gelatinilyticus]